MTYNLKNCIRLLFLISLLSFNTVLLFSQDSNVKITIKKDNITIKEAFREIEKQTKMYVAYNQSKFNDSRRISLNIDGESLRTVLDKILEGTDYSYELKDDQIMIIIPLNKILEKTVTIEGRVTDEYGEPVIGATIRIKGNKSYIMISDIDGKYYIMASPGDVLEVSYIGMLTQEIIITKNKTNVDAVLRMNEEMLKDVIVTGYQTISKERSAGSFTIVKGKEIGEKANLSGSILNSLEGLSTGLNININDEDNKFLIRGLTSINSSRSPLFVVDGMPMNQELVESMINNSDIENVTFLKDATAASIWGSQAANGVVVITTKKGVNGQPLKIGYSGTYTYKGMPDYDYLDKMNSNTFIKNATEVFDPVAYPWSSVTSSAAGTSGIHGVVYPHELALYDYANGKINLTERDARLAKLASKNGRKSYEDEFMSSSYFTKHTITISSGGRKHSNYTSMSYTGAQGNNKDWTDHFVINTRQDYKITNWLTWDASLNIAYEKTNRSVLPSTSDLPYALYRDENGNQLNMADYKLYESVRQAATVASSYPLDFYPVRDFDRSINDTRTTNVRINTGLKFNLLKGLIFESRLNYVSTNSETEKFLDSENYDVMFDRVAATPKSTGQTLAPKTGGNYTINNSRGKDWTVRNQLSYDNSFDDSKHQIVVLAGTEIRSNLYHTDASFARGYNMQTMSYDTKYDANLFQGSSQLTAPVLSNTGSGSIFSDRYYTGTETNPRYFSLYTNAAYTFDHRYSINASMRIDQSSLFGSSSSNKYKPIWAVGGSWNISNEKFMEGIDKLSMLKFRLSYGLGGVSPDPGIGGKYNLLQFENSLYAEAPGYQIIYPKNSGLIWEKTQTVNIGLDAAFFNNRVDFALDIYNKKTTDLLSTLPLNPLVGWPYTVGNIGSLYNKGFELTVNSHNIKSRDFNWFTTLTMSYNKNKITKLNQAIPYTPKSYAMTSIFVEGYASNAVFAYQWAGLSNEGYPQVYDKEGNLKTLSSDTDLVDFIYKGSTLPSWYGGLTNRLSYKQFELSFMFSYNLGHKLRNDVNTQYNNRLTNNLHKDFDKRWRQAGDEENTDIPKYSSLSDSKLDAFLYQKANINVKDASYIKLRDLTFSYTLPQYISTKFYTENLKLSVQASNLFYVAFNGEGIDPEAFNLSTGTRTLRYGPSVSFSVSAAF